MFVNLLSIVFSALSVYRHRNNPLYGPTSAALKSRDPKHVTSTTGACSTCCQLILVLISLLLAAAAVAMAIVAITMLLAGACF